MTRIASNLKKYINIISISLLSIVVINLPSNELKLRKIVRFSPDLKYILLWTNNPRLIGNGQEYFRKKRCQHTNCFLTRERNFLGNTQYFDAIVFNAKDVTQRNSEFDLPRTRSLDQKFIFSSDSSSDNYPVCDAAFDNFFNWTWTYRSDSTIRYQFITIYNKHNEWLGNYFKWNNDMRRISDRRKSQLNSKQKAATIFIDKCHSNSKREIFLKELKKSLEKLNHTLDIYGECGEKKCRRKTMKSCFWRLKHQYFFYLAFEDSFSKDFITDELLYAYQNDAVPIVRGAGDYAKILPPQSYINVGEHNPETLAKQIKILIDNRPLYHDFFKWKNHYVLIQGEVLNACDLCQKMNTPAALVHRNSYSKFREWWNDRFQQKCQEQSRFSGRLLM